MSASREQTGFPKHYPIILALVTIIGFIVMVVVITTMVILHITDPKADEKELLRDLHARSVAVDYAESITFDLLMALKPRLSDPDALTSKSELQRTYNLSYTRLCTLGVAKETVEEGVQAA